MKRNFSTSQASGVHIKELGRILSLLLIICFNPWFTLHVSAATPSNDEEVSIFEAILANLTSIRNFDVHVVKTSTTLPREVEHFSKVQTLETRREFRFIHQLSAKKIFLIWKLRRVKEKSDRAPEGILEQFYLDFYENSMHQTRSSKHLLSKSSPVRRPFETFATSRSVGSPQFASFDHRMIEFYGEPSKLEFDTLEGLREGTTIERLPDGTRRVIDEGRMDEASTFRLIYVIDPTEYRLLHSETIIFYEGKSNPQQSTHLEYGDQRFPFLPTKISFKRRTSLPNLDNDTVGKIVADEMGTIELQWHRVDVEEPMLFPDMERLAYDLKEWEKVLTTSEFPAEDTKR